MSDDLYGLNQRWKVRGTSYQGNTYVHTESGLYVCSVPHEVVDRIVSDHNALAAAAPSAEAQTSSPTWPLVLAFAHEMERKLAQNRHKGDRSGWLHVSPESLIERIGDEFGELCEAVDRRDPSQHVYDEAADVANFAMMVADSYGYAVGKGLIERVAPAAETERGGEKVLD